MAHQHALTCPSHAMLLVVFFQPAQPFLDRGILFRLSLFGAKGVVTERVQAHGRLLSVVEGEDVRWWRGGLLEIGWNGRHLHSSDACYL